MVSFDGAMPFSVKDFVIDCERLLSERDYKEVRILLGEDEGVAHNKMMVQWQRFERALTNEIVWMRATQLQRNSVNEMHGARDFDADVMQVITQAAKTENLLEVEKIIMRLQWQRLDELTVNQVFSLDFILAYALKLKILERLNAFKTDEGPRQLEEIMEEAANSGS